ncbi:uncharacterized protein LOC143921031 [Arctopsyche grandis]|uniref:uncharacterized protein LOC143921031 n=1 Tax=Arctopsyche grandis TaxID=121162 RepID=UPI00406D9FF0
MVYKWIGIVFLVLGYSACTIFGQDGFVHELDIDDKSKLPEDGRLPLENHESCAENELLYPGDEPGDWICDCKPGHVYVPKWNKCFPVFQRGPCRKTQYLIMPKNSRIPKCKLNSCVSYGNVLFNKRCVKIGDPCGPKNEFGVYGVNETTLDFGCVKAPMNFGARFTDAYCVPGTKRYNRNLCSDKGE